MSKSPRSPKNSRSPPSRSPNRAASRSPEGARARSPSLDPIPGTSRGGASQAPLPAGAEGPSFRSDDQPEQERRAEAAYGQSRRGFMVKNFIYKIHRLIKHIKFKFWQKQCLMAFSPRISEGEEFQLIWESTMSYITTLEGIQTFISESTFEENLRILQSNYVILESLVENLSDLLVGFRKGIQEGKFIHGGDSRGAYGPITPKFTKITHHALLKDLIIHPNIIGMNIVLQQLHKIFLTVSTIHRSQRINSLRAKITDLIEAANAKLQHMASTDRLEEQSPAEVVFDPNETETRSILRSDRQFSPKRISVGSVHRRSVAIEMAAGEDLQDGDNLSEDSGAEDDNTETRPTNEKIFEDSGAEDDNTEARPITERISEEEFETLEDFDYRRADERTEENKKEMERRRQYRTLQEENRRMGLPLTPFQPRLVRHKPKRAIPKDPFVSTLTQDYPNPRMVIWTSPPPSPERPVEAEEDGNQDEDTTGHDSHNVLRLKRRCRPRDDERFDALRPSKRHRRAA